MTLAHLIWFIATAVMTTTVLTVGTLAAADLLPQRRRARHPATEPRERRDEDS
ncbi:hypothetical protein [Nocardioides lijunqiniae]|uniref:hypothetical protein n=1 Tax=Nocardioides lijunqiniae TaxID=2760832 RepID=UPI0018786912|nr:hypothetical protein [Nocardioides lijunqiniae]